MSTKSPWLALFLFMLLSACAQQPDKPLQIRALDQLPALAAEFETTVIETGHGGDQPQRYQWRFWRAADRVETHNLQDNSGEIWEKAADRTVTYQRVFHDQRQVIDYLPGDLKAIGAEPDWSAIATLLNQAMQASLATEGREDILAV